MVEVRQKPDEARILASQRNLGDTSLKFKSGSVLSTSINPNMRWLLSLLVAALLGLAQALSSSGRRLLVVIEEASEKAKYSTFWGDLEGMFNSAKIFYEFH